MKRSDAEGGLSLTHRFGVGQSVEFETGTGLVRGAGSYKVVRLVPVENDNRLCYRIKSASETFERIAEEHQLSRAE